MLNKAHRLQKQANTVESSTNGHILAEEEADKEKKGKHDEEGATRGGRKEMSLREDRCPEFSPNRTERRGGWILGPVFTIGEIWAFKYWVSQRGAAESFTENGTL